MSSLTFESLPDEILMIIFQYSGNIFNILRTYLGLNQHLNNILLDKRLHLLTDFLFIHPRNDYYNSEIFQQVSQQLSSINTTINEENLGQLLQPLISFHIRQRYIQLGEKFRSTLAKFQLIRQQLTNDERSKVDHELKTQFNKLDRTPTIDSIKYITSLVLRKGARLECDDYELGLLNLTKGVNERILCDINKTESHTLVSINSVLQLFKSLIVSNTSLLNNRDYVGNGGCNLEYFLIYTLYRLKYFYGPCSSTCVNMKCYRTTIEFFLFVFQCRKQISDDDDYIQRDLFDILGMISEIHKDLFIRTVQLEIVKIVVDEYVLRETEPWNDYFKNTFIRTLRQLIKNRRLDVLRYIYRHFEFEEFFNEPNYIRECVNMITTNHLGRQFFFQIMDEKSLDMLFSKKYLLFILLDKKERKLLQKILKLSPGLIDQLDEDGNDPLLYICLKVSGCRHRIIEFLINMGSDIQRRNFNGQNFLEILQLQRNKKLFQKLVEHEIIRN
jgi:hypothetical protein